VRPGDELSVESEVLEVRASKSRPNDSKLDEYREVRAALGKQMKEVLATADEPRVVADVVLKAASAPRPKLRYTAGALARRMRLLRSLAPAGLVDAGLRKELRLDAPAASLRRTPVLEK
jgi:hypothetical protein